MELAELGYWIIAAFQHLRSFAQTAENIHEFSATTEAGRVAVFLNAIRGRGVLPFDELLRIAKAQKIGEGPLKRQLIPILVHANADRVVVSRSHTGHITIEENIDTNTQLYEIVATIWNSLDPTIIERGAVFILQDTFIRPRTMIEQYDLLNNSGIEEEFTKSSVAIAASFDIVRSFSSNNSDDNVIFNPYIWRSNPQKIALAISKLPTQEKSAIDQTVELVSQSQATPLANLDIDRKLFETAHAVGLVDVVQVNTAAGDKKEFIFTPHLTTHPDESHLADDLLNDVRAVLACVGYGENYSKISRLGGPSREITIATLKKLLREQETGDATAIGVDYTLLEERGIITVEPTNTWPGGRYRMKLLREAPIRIALRAIESSVGKSLAAPTFVRLNELDPGAFFASPEETRILSSPMLGRQPQHVREAREHYLRAMRKEIF